MQNELKFLLYTSNDTDVNIDVVIRDETLWVTQKAMAELFNVGIPAISKHLANIFESGELDENVVISKMETTTQHGAISTKTQTHNVNYYNLDAIISVGYRVNSQQATRFRQWSTSVLKEYMIKGFVLDDERLKQGEKLFNTDYFEELLERVRSIRASERRVWQKITDIFAEISIDYDNKDPFTREFYAMVQNKFHYAITGQTGADIINTHADITQEHMGLKTWKNSPTGRVIKQDVSVAKNYLDEKQIRQLERSVSSYLDYIEGLIERRQKFTMVNFAESIDKFLMFQEYKVLDGRGSISSKNAKHNAEIIYDDFNKTQVIVSDFDKEVKHLIDSNENK